MENSEKRKKRNSYEHSYKMKHYKRISVLIPKKDNDALIDFLESKKSISNYVLKLIQEDFESQKKI